MRGNGVPGQRPPAIHCYLCGQGYGTASISIHIKACMKKWEIEQSKKPPRERRPIPNPPESFLMAIQTGGKLTSAQIETINNEGFNEYNKNVLEPCENCGRTFKPDSLKIHLRSCHADRPLKPLNKPTNTAPVRQIEEEEYEEPVKAMPKAPVKAPAPVKTTTTTSKPIANTKVTTTTAKPPTISKLGSSTKVNVTSKPQPVHEFDDDEFDGYFKKPAKPTKPIPSTSQISKPSDRVVAKPQPKAMTKKAPSYHIAEETGLDGDLVPCKKCGRTFASDRVAKHEKVCKVNSKPKKVKVFHKPLTDVEKKKMDKLKTHKWKAQHEEFQRNIEYIRKMKAIEAKGGNIRDLPPPPPSNNSNLIQCSYCTRKFNPEAHERHEQACKNTINKPKPIPKAAMQHAKPVVKKR